jgi:hypothetical protein
MVRLVSACDAAMLTRHVIAPLERTKTVAKNVGMGIQDVATKRGIGREKEGRAEAGRSPEHAVARGHHLQAAPDFWAAHSNGWKDCNLTHLRNGQPCPIRFGSDSGVALARQAATHWRHRFD